MRTKRGLSIIEIVVVIAIIMILIGLLLPTVRRARASAMAVQCRSNLHQIGLAIEMYASANKGWVIPIRIDQSPITGSWPEMLFGRELAAKIDRCPTADDYLHEHRSYLLNMWLYEWQVRSHSSKLGGLSPPEVVLAGENIPEIGYDYLPPVDYPELQYDPYRHGKALGSNYLWLDMHVDNTQPRMRPFARHPWDLPLNRTRAPMLLAVR